MGKLCMVSYISLVPRLRRSLIATLPFSGAKEMSKAVREVLRPRRAGQMRAQGLRLVPFADQYIEEMGGR